MPVHSTHGQKKFFGIVGSCFSFFSLEMHDPVANIAKYFGVVLVGLRLRLGWETRSKGVGLLICL